MIIVNVPLISLLRFISDRSCGLTLTRRWGTAPISILASPNPHIQCLRLYTLFQLLLVRQAQLYPLGSEQAGEEKTRLPADISILK